MNDPIKSDNTGIIVAVIVAALLVVGGIFWNQHDSEDRAHQAESDAQTQRQQKEDRAAFEESKKRYLETVSEIDLSGFTAARKLTDENLKYWKDVVAFTNAEIIQLNRELANTPVTVDNLSEVELRKGWLEDVKQRLKLVQGVASE